MGMNGLAMSAVGMIAFTQVNDSQKILLDFAMKLCHTI